MAARTRRVYTDEEKARVRYLLEIHDWNVLRSSEDSGVPRKTVADWARQWKKAGVPDEVESIAVEIATNYLADAEYVRDAALAELRKRVGNPDTTTKDLYTMFGILSDKIDRAKGLATRHEKVVVELPDVRKLSEQLGGFLAASLAAARQRQGEIIEAEDAEYAQEALPPSTT